MSFWGGGKKVHDDQDEYFDMPMAELLSNYKFVLCSSESSGDMAIGIIEAMASGCFVFKQTFRQPFRRSRYRSHNLQRLG